MTNQKNDCLKLCLNANFNELEKLTSALTAFFDCHAIDAKNLTQVNLIFEELFTNSIKYGIQAGSTLHVEIEIKIQVKILQMTYRDNGIPFNVLEAPSPNLELPIEERPIGGLGIHIVKAFTNSAQYRYFNQMNVLVLTKNIK